MYVRQDDCSGLSSCLSQSSTMSVSPNDVDLMDENGNTPLLVAARLGHQNSFRLLLQHGADALHVNRMGSYRLIAARFPFISPHIPGVNAMTLAAFSGNLDIIAMLLHYAPLDYYCNTTFIPPICAATIAGHDRVVQWFCDTYQDPKPEQLPKSIEGQWKEI